MNFEVKTSAYLSVITSARTAVNNITAHPQMMMGYYVNEIRVLSKPGRFGLVFDSSPANFASL